MTCDICRGGKTIRLPVHHDHCVVYDQPETINAIKEYARTFDCPQCSDKQPVTKLQMVQVTTDRESFVDRDIAESYMIDLATHAIARKLAEMKLVKKEFKRDAYGTLTGTTQYRFSLAVFQPSVLNGVMDAVREERARIADEFREAACEKIRRWACHYTGDEGNISKGQAVTAVCEAVVKVLGESE